MFACYDWLLDIFINMFNGISFFKVSIVVCKTCPAYFSVTHFRINVFSRLRSKNSIKFNINQSFKIITSDIFFCLFNTGCINVHKD